MTDGAASHPGSQDWPPPRLAAERLGELFQAIECLGGTLGDVTWLGHPDGWLGAQDQRAIAARVADLCRARGAQALFAPATEDHHEDHKTTARIARMVAASVPGLVLYSYSVWGRWDDPCFLSRIARHMPVALNTGPWRQAKRAAIAAHATQLGRVVHDDPAGFAMSAAFVDAFADTPEIYWRAR